MSTCIVGRGSIGKWVPQPADRRVSPRLERAALVVAALLAAALPVRGAPPQMVATVALASEARSTPRQGGPSSKDALEVAAAYRRAQAHDQAFTVLGEALEARGFTPELAQAVVDTALASDDPDSGLELAARLPGLAGRALSAHLTLATTDRAPSVDLEALLHEPLAPAAPGVDRVYEHLEAVANRHLKEGPRGQALLLWLLARARAGLDWRPQLARLLAGPQSWRRHLDRVLLAADPLSGEGGDFWNLATRYWEALGTDETAGTSHPRRRGKSEAPTQTATAAFGRLCEEFQNRAALSPQSAGPAAAVMALRARMGDRGGAALWARRAAAAARAGAAPSLAATLRLADLMGRAGLAEEGCSLLGSMEHAQLASVAGGARPASPRSSEAAAQLFVGLASLSILDRRDERAFEHLRRALDMPGDPAPAFACLERLGTLPAHRERAVAMLVSTTSQAVRAWTTAARILERAGDRDAALGLYRRVLDVWAVPAAGRLPEPAAHPYLRAAWLESAGGRGAAALDVLAAGLRALPGEPRLIAELLRQTDGLGRADLTLATLARLHPSPPTRTEWLGPLLEELEARAKTSSERSALSTLLTDWLEQPGAAAPEIRIALGTQELALAHSARAASAVEPCLARPPGSLIWTRKLLEVLRLSSPSGFPATAAARVLPAGAGGRALYFQARARSLAAEKRTTAAAHAGLLALDADPGSPSICADLVRWVRAYPSPGYLMGAFTLKTRGNPLYAPFQARYHVADKDFSTARSYYRPAIRAFPDDLALRLEYARFLTDQGDDKAAAQVYLGVGERMGYRYDRCWGPPLIRIALARRDTTAFLEPFSRWLLEDEALDSGILRSFLRLSKQADLLEAAAELLARLAGAEPRLVTLHEALALVSEALARPADAARALEAREASARQPDARLAGVHLADLFTPDPTPLPSPARAGD
ncbi:MAG: hypothetical protein HY816_18420 [Candidatus Wallbacteria bacterium]|nr:hypothetical protein [Candidatus Wallbacteria bacterium]